MNKLLGRSFLAFFFVVSTSAAAVDTEYLQGLGDTRYFEIESDRVGRSFHIFVMLPDGYKLSADKTYPTIYVLDGGALFPLLSSYSRYLKFGEEIPEVIIVGISYGSASFANGNRRSTDYTAKSEERDYWGGAGHFQSFLEQELMPHVEKTFRSRSDRRVIFGHSIGGQFVLYTALTKPTLFWGHMASNPALHRNLPFFLQNHAEVMPQSPGSKLFVGDGTLNDSQYRTPSQQWIEHWSARDNKPWMLKTMDLEGHSHMSAPPAAFRAGLRWLFDTQ